MGGNQRYGLMIQESGTTILLWLVIGSLLCGLGSLVAQYLFIENMNQIGEAYNSGKSHFNSASDY